MVYQRAHKSSLRQTQSPVKSSLSTPRPFAVQTQQESSVEQRKSDVLQAKMDDFWAQRVERENPQPGSPDTPGRAIQTTGPAATVQPKQAMGQGTGLPDGLKAGVQNLSGYSMDDVKVRYNSDKPAQLNAHAYAQGTDIHVAAGQEQHLAHEAWHVVQQKQGRVKPTVQMKAGMGVNDDPALETEANVMAAKLGAPYPEPRARDGAGQTAQLRKDANRSSVIELTYPQAPSGTAPAQLLAIANVVVFNKGDGARVAAIRFAERVPTTVGDGQGDHGVAEVLIQESITALEGRSVYEFLKGLYDRALANLEGIEIARHTSQLGESSQINKAKLLHEIATLAGNLSKTPPENLQYLLSEVTTKYWRLLEKRDLTAFDRKEKRTTGGGQEKDGIQGLRRIKQRLHSSTGRDIDYTREDALADAIGYTPFLMDLIAHEFNNENLGTLTLRAAAHVADFFGIDDESFVEELADQLGYSFLSLKGQESDGYFGLKAEGSTSDLREEQEVREFATWEDARYARLWQGELIRITGHHPDISDRVFRVRENYDPSIYEHPPDVPPVDWINR